MNLRPWEAEVEADEDLARRLIETQFLALAPARLVPFAVGWDNTAWLVNETWIFRFPRRAIAVPLMETEIELLPHLAPRLPLPVPHPVHVGRPENGYPWPFAGYRHLPGRSADALDLDGAARARAAAPIARFLRTLHDVPSEESGAHGAPHDRFKRLDLALRIPRVQERLNHVRALGHLDDVAPFAEILETVRGLDRDVGSTTLVHGDLYARHLLVDDEGVPTGVVDWGDVHVGDPASDLAVVWSYLPPEAREVFYDTYGPVAEPTLRLARFRALLTTLWLLSYGHDIDDRDLLREGQRALEHLSVD